MYPRMGAYPRIASAAAVAALVVLVSGCTRQKVTYKGLKLTRPVVEGVTGADVTRFLNQLRNQMATPVDLPPGTSAANGHRVTVDFVGTVGGTAFMGGTASAYPLVLGSDQMIPGFEEGIVGMRVGEVRNVKVTFPADYTDPALAGKPASFRVTLRGVEGLRRPALTDDFASQVSRGQLTSVEQLRGALREQIARQKQAQAEQSLRAQAAEALLAQWRGEPGKREVNRELDRVVQQHLQSAAQRGTGPALGGPDADAIREANRPAVSRRIRLSKVFAWVAKQEGISVSDGELEQYASQMARQQGQEPTAFMDMLRKQKAIDLVRRQILEERVMGLILQNAVIEEPKKLVRRGG